MDGRRLRSSHDVEGNGLMRVAAKAFHFEIAVPGVDRVAQRRRWLRRTLKGEHALVPRPDGKPVFLARFRCPLSRRPDRRAVNGLAYFGAQDERMCPATMTGNGGLRAAHNGGDATS